MVTSLEVNFELQLLSQILALKLKIPLLPPSKFL